MRNAIWAYFLALGCVIIDQLLKLWADQALPYNQALPILPFLNMTLAYNEGAAFSFLAQHPQWGRWLLSGLALIISIGLIIWIKYLKAHEKYISLGAGLVLGGAIGNLIDRLAYGHVIDYIDVYYKAWHWPIFNFADITISIGAFLIVIAGFFEAEQPHHINK